MENKSDAKKAEDRAFEEEDYYAILKIDATKSAEEIRKAYKVASLKFHPDKNRHDLENASKKFLLIKKAFEILSDEKAKEAYDRVVKAKQQRIIRDKQMDQNRKRMIDDLEERERSHKKKRSEEEEARRKLDVEIERLRKEGFKRRMEQLQKQKEQEVVQNENQPDAPKSNPAFKVSWDKKKGKYSKEKLEEIFKKYGEIDMVVASSKSGIVILKCFYSPSMTPETFVSLQTKLGDPNNPLSLDVKHSTALHSTKSHQIDEDDFDPLQVPDGLFDSNVLAPENTTQIHGSETMSAEDHLNFERMIMEKLMRSNQTKTV